MVRRICIMSLGVKGLIFVKRSNMARQGSTASPVWTDTFVSYIVAYIQYRMNNKQRTPCHSSASTWWACRMLAVGLRHSGEGLIRYQSRTLTAPLKFLIWVGWGNTAEREDIQHFQGNMYKQRGEGRGGHGKGYNPVLQLQSRPFSYYQNHSYNILS